MVFEIQNVQDLRKAIKSSIDNTNDFPTTTDILRNSVLDFLDQTGLVNESLEILKDELKCPVCLDVPLETCLTECNHIFCRYCLYMCSIQKSECPMCRTALSVPEPLFKADAIIAAVMSKHNPQYDSWKKQELDEKFHEYHTKSLEDLLCRAVMELKQIESFNDFYAGILRRDLGDMVQRIQSLLKELPCSEASHVKFTYTRFFTFEDFKRLRDKIRKYYTERTVDN